MLTAALEEEVTAYIAAHATERDETGRRSTGADASGTCPVPTTCTAGPTGCTSGCGSMPAGSARWWWGVRADGKKELVALTEQCQVLLVTRHLVRPGKLVLARDPLEDDQVVIESESEERHGHSRFERDYAQFKVRQPDHRCEPVELPCGRGWRHEPGSGGRLRA